MTNFNWNRKKNGVITSKRNSVYIANGTEGSCIVDY
jgi:hypothetical protein